MRVRSLPLCLALPLLCVLTSCGVQPRRASPEAAHATRPPAHAASEIEAGPSWTGASEIGAVVADRPQTARVFELLDIDYCCGGGQTLEDAARKNDIELDRLLGALEVVGRTSASGTSRSWTNAPLAELIAHIESTYHVKLRRELPRLDGLVAKVVRVHGGSHPELAEVGRLYTGLRTAIIPHLVHEEEEVFPAILASPPGDPASIRKLLGHMNADHDEVGEALHRLRELTQDYEPPEDACVLYKQMLRGLAELERDLHAHVHLENNVLMPRALAALKGA